MNRYKLFQWKAVIMLGVLMLSLMMATPAFADETPPPSGTEESTPEAQPSGEKEPAPVENSSEEETVEVQESAPPVETEASEQSSQEETVSEILEQLPEDTELIIVDENGEALPLASEAAEEAVVLKDPIWCPVGVAPKPGVGGCSGSFVSLSALVAGFVPTKNGVIWIEVGNDTGAQVEIDGGLGGNWETAANFSLTLQGGWIGPAGPPVGSGAIIGTTVFDTAISIVNWNGAVTINDISFDGANNTLNGGTGSLYVQTTKNIVLSNVMSINSAGAGNDGAYLDNTSSTTQATVTVKNSTFNSNNLRGITIISDGAVTLTNVTANSNTSYGVYIENNYDTTASVVSVTKGFYNQNGNEGLHVISNGSVTLSQIVASANTVGIYVDNTSAPTSQAVTVSNLTATTNTGIGLSILSDGVVTLTTITTDYNFSGTVINNSTAPKPLAVTINGFNSMNGNSSGNGLYITSLGVITVNNINANFNSGYGAYINNTGSTLPSAVNIKGTNIFNNNSVQGLFVQSRGAITVYNTTANGNGFLTDVTGVFLDNYVDATKPQNVTLLGMNTFNNNANTGLMIFSYGIVTLNNITANYNGFDNINTDGGGVVILNSGGTLARPVSIKGTNNFSGNDSTGLAIVSLGAISISNITANDNGDDGANIDNRFGSFQSPVTISGYGIFNANVSTGLEVLSNGAITTTNLSAQLNTGSGAYLDTYGLTNIQAVNLKGNNTFISNGNNGNESGLIVYADGNITVSNLTASQNYYDGAYLNNYSNWFFGPPFTTFGSVTITGFGNFQNNFGRSGLFIWTQGNVTMSYVTADRNGFDGVAIDAKGKVSLTCVLVTANGNLGFVTYNQPVTYITIKGLSAVGNGTNEALAYLGGIRSRCTG